MMMVMIMISHDSRGYGVPWKAKVMQEIFLNIQFANLCAELKCLLPNGCFGCFMFTLFHISGQQLQGSEKLGESRWKKYMNAKTPFISTFDLYDHSKSFGQVLTFVSRSWLGIRLAVLKKSYKLDLSQDEVTRRAQNPDALLTDTSHPSLNEKSFKRGNKGVGNKDYQDRWPYILDKNEFIYF